MRILILDDMHDIRKLLIDMLEGPEVWFNEAEACNQAIALLAEYDFDWAILDNTLPDGQGLDVLRHIRKIYPQVKVIMVTADVHIESEALALGALRLFAKGREICEIKTFIEQAGKE